MRSPSRSSTLPSDPFTDDDVERLTLRCRRLNGAPYRADAGDYVLCWLQQTLRGVGNPVIDAAIALGTRFERPVVVYHGLGRHYPHASHRLHRFILEASRSLERDVEERGLRFLRHVERDAKPERGLVYRLAERAVAIVTDEQAAFVARWQADTVARKAGVAVIAVDGARLVPELAIAERCRTTAGFRARVNALREDWLDERLDLPTSHARFDGELATTSDDLGVDVGGAHRRGRPSRKRSAAGDDSAREMDGDTSGEASVGVGVGGGEGEGGSRGGALDAPLDALILAAGVDMSLPPVGWCSGDRRSAETHLAWAAERVVTRYAARRNDPSDITTTRLSPWLHFGVLGPHDVLRALDAVELPSRDAWKFLDEMLVWREYFHHLARHADDPTSYANLPHAARDTLAAHAGDRRPALYPLDVLIHGESADATWNAAQRAFLAEGWMHNNLRMYWGKKLIEWTTSPERAWRTACYLNDRLALDGRDPATYGNLRWCFGASRPASEAAVYGRVPRHGDGAIRRRAGEAWIEREATRAVPRVCVPDAITLEPRPQASGKGLPSP